MDVVGSEKISYVVVLPNLPVCVGMCDSVSLALVLPRHSSGISL